MEIAFTHPAEFRKFIAKLGADDRARVLHLIETLSAAPSPLTPPHGKSLGGKLWELRATSGQRIYFHADGTDALVLTQGRKDTQQRDIERARRRQP